MWSASRRWRLRFRQFSFVGKVKCRLAEALHSGNLYPVFLIPAAIPLIVKSKAFFSFFVFVSSFDLSSFKI